MVLNARQVVDSDEKRLILLSIEDVTERNLAHEQMRELAAELRRSNDELQEFARVASHDLQEPLRKIQAFGDRLQNAAGVTLTSEARHYLERMQHAAARMRRLIEDLLVFSRVDKQGLGFTRVDLPCLVEEVLSDLEAVVQESAGRVTVGPIVPAIEADAVQVRQLIQNLVSNALKYRKPGVAPVVRIHSGLIRDGRGVKCCEIAVADEGIGFDEKYLDRIFQVFQRLHGRGEYEGTGVGLAVCRKIVERHRGTITASSRPGEGATFFVRLPVSQTEQFR
jgi:light-regulated signal transduction histidine kinase (bacteriophytochrome)